MGWKVISAAITPLSLEIMKSCQRYDFEELSGRNWIEGAVAKPEI